jgi:hypothetical protein
MKTLYTRLIYILIIAITVLIIGIVITTKWTPEKLISLRDTAANIIIFFGAIGIFASYHIGRRHGWTARGKMERNRVKSTYGIKFTEHKEV